ncbi:MAG: G1 family glutamic endopeptidase [Phycisphaerae bacterium]
MSRKFSSNFQSHCGKLDGLETGSHCPEHRSGRHAGKKHASPTADATERASLRTCRSLLAGAALCAAALSATNTFASTPITTSSNNWSGYALTAPSKSAFTSVVGSWTVPTVTASPDTSSGTYAAFWVGLDGFGTNSVEQLGVSADYSNSSGGYYYAWTELYPAGSYSISGFAVHPGDKITASVTYTGAGTGGSEDFTLAIQNTTTGQAYTDNASTSGVGRTTAEWIAEAPATVSSNGSLTVLPLANFGSATFTDSFATLASSSGSQTSTITGLTGTQAYQINLGSGTNKLSANTSKLSSEGTAFNVATGTNSFPVPQAPVNNYAVNGNFTANASFYSAYPGYDAGTTANPSAPTDWTALGNVGVNGGGTRQTNSPFAPSNAGSVTFAFLQGAGSSISQQLTGLTIGQKYLVSYAAAARNGDTSVDLTASVLGTSGQHINSALAENGFTNESFSFIADASTATLEFLNSSGAGDLTADVTDVSVTAVPEPATLALFGICGAGLLLVRRKRA